MIGEERVEKSFCRICGGICAVEVTIKDGKIAKVRGDKSDPLTRGFTCLKGLQARNSITGPAACGQA